MTIRKSIYQIIEADEKFSILLKILDQTGIGKALRHEEEPLTFFAPTDGAFYQMLQNGSLTDGADGGKVIAASILGQHIIPGRVLYTEDLQNQRSLTNLEGAHLIVRRDSHRLFINEAQIVTPAVPALNGVIFGIDKVLFLAARHESGFS